MTDPKLMRPNVQPTTVFIGNISERAPDIMVRQMLARCGTVLQWKRATGANGKLQVRPRITSIVEKIFFKSSKKGIWIL